MKSGLVGKTNGPAFSLSPLVCIKNEGLDPKAFMRMPSDKCRFEPTSAFHSLPSAWSHKASLAEETRNAFHLASKSARGAPMVS